MTLLDAPKFDEAREKRRMVYISSTVTCLLVLFVVWWFVAGRPVDWPWNWNNYLFGRAAVNNFLTAVEKNDLQSAYGSFITWCGRKYLFYFFTGHICGFYLVG